VVRYADDFVVFCESKEAAEQSVTTLTKWLNERGLEFSPEKTRIVHLTEGFDFLGFNVRLYQAPKTAKSGWKLLIKPSKESVTKIREKLRGQWRHLKGQNAKAAVKELNPIIRGWANYFRISVASKVFQQLDEWMFRREVRYAKRNHPKKSAAWMQARYFGRLNPERDENWVFGDKESGMHIVKFRWFPIERHVLVRGQASPDDAELKDYWAGRNRARARDFTAGRRKLAERQSGCCSICGESLFNGEELHVHHRVAKHCGGWDSYGNLALVHFYCHQQIHARADV